MALRIYQVFRSYAGNWVTGFERAAYRGGCGHFAFERGAHMGRCGAGALILLNVGPMEQEAGTLAGVGFVGCEPPQPERIALSCAYAPASGAAFACEPPMEALWKQEGAKYHVGVACPTRTAAPGWRELVSLFFRRRTGGLRRSRCGSLHILRR